MRARVECYAGHRYPERPRAFFWEGERKEVQEIKHSWRIPGGLVFRVRVADDRCFTLTYDENTAEWNIQPDQKTVD